MSLSELMACDPARDDTLILVDVHDREVGAATKERAHVDALLHRAFSVVLMRDGETGPELLVAKRSLAKYHSGGLWANSCCSHPRVGEKTIDAAYRRVREELGCEAVGLREISSFVYRADFENGITEYEFDHVLLGGFEGEIVPDPAEASEVRWVGLDALAKEIETAPQLFSAWAPRVFSDVSAFLAMR